MFGQDLGQGQAELRKAAEALMQPCPITLWGSDQIDVIVSNFCMLPRLCVRGGQKLALTVAPSQAEQNALKNEKLPEFPACVEKPAGLEVSAVCDN